MKERKGYFERVVTNMQSVLLDPDLINVTMQYLCQLARWLCLQLSGKTQE